MLPLLGRLPTPPPARRALRRRFANQFRRPDRSYKLLEAMIIEINGSSFRIGLRDGSDTVLFVPNCLSFR